MIWSIANFDKKAQQAIKECQRYKKLIESKDIRFKNLPPPAEPPRNVFSISPSTIEIKPNEEIVIDLEGKFISVINIFILSIWKFFFNRLEINKELSFLY